MKHEGERKKAITHIYKSGEPTGQSKFPRQQKMKVIPESFVMRGYADSFFSRVVYTAIRSVRLFLLNNHYSFSFPYLFILPFQPTPFSAPPLPTYRPKKKKTIACFLILLSFRVYQTPSDASECKKCGF